MEFLPSQKCVVLDLIRFAKALQQTLHFSKKIRSDNEHLEFFLSSGVDLASFDKLDVAIKELEKGL